MDALTFAGGLQLGLMAMFVGPIGLLPIWIIAKFLWF